MFPLQPPLRRGIPACVMRVARRFTVSKQIVTNSTRFGHGVDIAFVQSPRDCHQTAEAL